MTNVELFSGKDILRGMRIGEVVFSFEFFVDSMVKWLLSFLRAFYRGCFCSREDFFGFGWVNSV